MAGRTTTSLYLQLDGGLTGGLTDSLKAGRTGLLNVGQAANDVQAEVRKAFAEMARAPDTLKQVENAYKQTLNNIRQNMKGVLAAPNEGAALKIIDAAGAEQAAAAARTLATALRIDADAAAAVAARNGEAAAGARVMAAALEAQAIQAEKSARALTTQAAVVAEVAAEAQKLGAVNMEAAREQAAADEVAAKAKADLAARAEVLLRSIDPLYAAQARYNAQVGEAKALLDSGAISTERYAAAETAAAQALRQVADAAGVAAEKQMELYRAQAADARAEVSAGRFQSLIAETEQVRLGNKSAADSYKIFEEAGVIAAEHVTAGHNRMGASGLIVDHVIRSMTDSIAAGQSPIRAVTMEMGRITEAMQLYALTVDRDATGAAAKFAGFMSGPWGIALTVGVAVLTPMIAKLIEGNGALDEAVDKLKKDAEQTTLTDAAHRAFSKTIEGEIAIQKKLSEELDKQVRTERQNQQDKLLQTRNNLSAEQAKRPGIAKDVATSQRAVDDGRRALNAARGDPDATSAIEIALGLAERKLAEKKKLLADADASIAAMGRNVREAEVPLIDSEVQASMDAKTAATLRYTEALGILRNQLAIGAGNSRIVSEQQRDGTFRDVRVQGIGEAEYRRRLAGLEAAKKAAEEAASAAKKAENDDHQVGRTINFAQAKSIVEGVGGRVTSAPTRSLAEQQRLYDRYMAYKDGSGPWAPLAAKPGTSLHGSGQAVDVAKSADVSLGELKEAFRKAGVHLTEALDEGDHYHLGFGKKGRAGPSEETLARREQAKVNRAANDDRSFQNADRQADDAIARAKLQLGASLDQEYKVKVDQIAADMVLKNNALQDQVTSGHLSQAQADQLKEKNAQVAILDEQYAADQRRLALANQDYDTAREESVARVRLLRIEAALADTADERLKLERQAFDEEQAQQRRDAQHAVDIARPGTPEAARADAALGRLPAQQAADGRQFGDQHKDQLAAYLDQLRSNAKDTKSALQNVKVDGLKGLEDGMLGVISGTETVASAFKKMADTIIADLARIAIEKLIVSAIGGGSFFGLKDGGKVPGYALGGLPGYAGGSNPLVANGRISGPGNGTSDSILAIVGGKRPILVSNGEAIVNARGVQKHWPLIDAINHDRIAAFASGGLVDSLPSVPTSYPALPRAEQLRPTSQHVAVTTHLEIEPSPMFDVRSRTIAEQTVGQSAQPIMAGATAQTMKRLRRQPLPGGYGG